MGSLLIPSDKRKYVFAVYAFARYADDIADSEVLSKDQKLIKLNDLSNELGKHGAAGELRLNRDTDHIFRALFDTIERNNMPVEEFEALLSAFRQDAVVSGYEEFDDLIDYSKRSANPIGHLVLNIFGYEKGSNEEMFRKSDCICTSLQLTNFWQDVSADLRISRIYLPLDLMRKYGYSPEELNGKIVNGSFRDLIKELCQRTRAVFDGGFGLPDMVNGRLRYELKAIIAGGLAILDKIEKLDYDVLNNRPVLNLSDKLSLIYKAFL